MEKAKQNDNDQPRTVKNLNVQVPIDVMGRVNARAELLGINQQECVIDCLEQVTADLVAKQDELKRTYASRQTMKSKK